MGEQTCLHVYLCSFPTKVKHLMSNHQSSPEHISTCVQFLQLFTLCLNKKYGPQKVLKIGDPQQVFKIGGPKKVFKGTDPQEVFKIGRPQVSSKRVADPQCVGNSARCQRSVRGPTVQHGCGEKYNVCTRW